MVHRSGRTERSVEAHQGAVLALRWNHDGTSLLTCGEDGAVKVSRFFLASKKYKKKKEMALKYSSSNTRSGLVASAGVVAERHVARDAGALRRRRALLRLVAVVDVDGLRRRPQRQHPRRRLRFGQGPRRVARPRQPRPGAGLVPQVPKDAIPFLVLFAFFFVRRRLGLDVRPRVGSL